MATKLKVIEAISAQSIPADIPAVPGEQDPYVPPKPDRPLKASFNPAPTRNRNAGWTADRQRKFIDHLPVIPRSLRESQVNEVGSRKRDS